MSTDCGEKFENPDSFHVVYMGDERSFDLEENSIFSPRWSTLMTTSGDFLTHKLRLIIGKEYATLYL
jgi:hypothetical protein